MNYNIFVINLPRCVEKRKKMKIKLRKHHINWAKTYDGRLLSKNIGRDHTNLYDMKADILKEWKDPHSGRNITWGEVGCALSHYEIYDYCVKHNMDNAVIFEDDAEIPENLSHKLAETFKSLERLEWDFCYIARKPMDPVKDIEIIPNILRPAYSYWLYIY